MTTAHLSEVRRWYSEEIRLNAQVSSPSIVAAFAEVPREKFLGPGPWHVKPAVPGIPYQQTASADPHHIYHDVLVALDRERGLNNGLPTWHARVLQAIDPKPGEQIVHLGCGVGYYTAIMKRIVENGSVVGLEIDRELARRAKENLADLEGVTVLNEDGSIYDFGDTDLIYVNAGVTHLQIRWIENLRLGGRLVAPLTIDGEDGQLLRITRDEAGYRAESIGGVHIFNCAGSRDPEEEYALKEAVSRYGWQFVGRLRFDMDRCDETCWLKAKHYWLARG